MKKALGMLLGVVVLAGTAVFTSYLAYSRARSLPARTGRPFGLLGHVKHDIVSIEAAVQQYAIEHLGRYPASLEPLLPTLQERNVLPVDPWGHAYVYTPPGPTSKGLVILSYGADGLPGGEGMDRDVTNQGIKSGEY